MLITPSDFPTPIAQVARRVNLTGTAGGSDSFLVASYLSEALLKTVVATQQAALSVNDEERAYRLGYHLIRADGLGTWEQALRRITGLPHVASLPRSVSKLTEWITKKRAQPEDQWFRDSLSNIERIVAEIGDVGLSMPQNPSVLDLVHGLVLIRNKTKAHGAYGPQFYATVNDPYIEAISNLLQSCPLMEWDWWLVHDIGPDQERLISVHGLSPTPADRDTLEKQHHDGIGLYVDPNSQGRAVKVGAIIEQDAVVDQWLITDRELSHFWLPNGSYTDTQKAEFVDYGNGVTTRLKDQKYIDPPAPLPSSRTEGRERLDVLGHVFANLPSFQEQYIRRPGLEKRFIERLRDRNHPIITLHGRGGIGKTSLALRVAKDLAKETDPRFEMLLWFSARDIELAETGPHRVRQSVKTLDDIVGRFSELAEFSVNQAEFAELLQEPDQLTDVGMLLVFDNFETFEDPRGVHRFLDTHTHMPNKVLLTSRERAFKADYPIKVHGMQPSEAEKLITGAARRLGIEGLIDEKTVRKIYEYAEGHPYIMRILVGEIAKERRYVPPAKAVSQRDDVVDAVFERSFRKLSRSGKVVFLTVGNWRSAIARMALTVVLSRRDVDVDKGINECTRFALLVEDELSDGHPCYRAPELARTFAETKLQGDPDRLAIEEDLEVLQKFGVISSDRTVQTVTDEPVDRFTEWCKEKAQGGDEETVQELDNLLQQVGEMWAPGWMKLAQFRMRAGMPNESIQYALRRAVEEIPYDPDAWLMRARYSQKQGDEEVYISSLVSAVDADPDNVALVSKAARNLANFVTQRKDEIPESRRGVYVASVRDHMEKLADKDALNADQLAQLGWLYLIEGKEEEAKTYANEGLNVEPENTHCLNIMEKVTPEL